MKYLAIITFVICCCTVAFSQENIEKSEAFPSLDPVDNVLNAVPLYIRSIAGSVKTISKDEFEKINADDISYVQVIDDPSSIYIYGDKGKNGVVLVVMKNGSFLEKYASRKRRQR